ncbi:MAG: alginate export family protein [Planctomycetes bacterium]|nr:alginate export family protein [Planctomycetota bacterium]
MKLRKSAGLGLCIMVGAVLILATTGTVVGADTGGYVQEPAKHWHEVDAAWMDTFHNPAEGLEFGLDFRFRETYGRNIFSLDDQFGDGVALPFKAGNWNKYHWQRYRTRLSTKWDMNEDVSFNSRLLWEFWTHTDPHRSFNSALSNQNTDFDEIIFDSLNLQFRNALDMPLTLTVGRQDIILGTGWLVLDGTPADGPRSIYFDAIRGTYQLSDATTLDMIYIQQYDGETKWLSPINHREGTYHSTQKQDEKGVILYLTNVNDGQQRELYYIYKNDEPSQWSRINTPSAIGQDAEIHTIGGRLAGKINDSWSYSAELAKQWGRREEQSMKGLGTNNRLTYAFNDDKNTQVFAMYEFLSGDNPTTTSSEKFDTLWGDWPQSQRGGELQAYLWADEGALGEVANMHRLGMGHSYNPCQNWNLVTMYNLLWADKNTYGGSSGPAVPGGPMFSNGGDFRGQLFSCVATYQCCPTFRTNFILDYFVPGSYYDGGTQDHAMLGIINMEWTF